MAVLLVEHSNFSSTSNDSRFYTRQVVRYVDKSYIEYFAPTWGQDAYGQVPTSLMKDHLPGHLLLGIWSVHYLGLSPQHALHVVQMFFLLASIFLLTLFVKRMGDLNIIEEGEQNYFRILPLLLILLPHSFSYSVRANQEASILFFLSLSMFISLYTFNKWIKILILAIFSLVLFWIKGIFFIFVPLTYVICDFCLTVEEFSLRKIQQKIPEYCSLFFITLCLVFLSAYAYESFIQKNYHESFFSHYFNTQYIERAYSLGNDVSGGSVWGTKLKKLWISGIYYSRVSLIYSAPWSLLFIIALFFKKIRIKIKKIDAVILLLTFCYLSVLIYSGRNASRYAIPVYYWLSIFFSFQLLRMIKPQIGPRLLFMYLALLIWLGVVVVKIYVLKG